jgi:hypothetical protein
MITRQDQMGPMDEICGRLKALGLAGSYEQVTDLMVEVMRMLSRRLSRKVKSPMDAAILYVRRLSDSELLTIVAMMELSK